MIRASSEQTPFRTRFSNGSHEAVADAPKAKGGGEDGFGPHELLEAALATCLAMTLEMYARKQGFPLERAEALVRLDRSQPGEPVFEYELRMFGSLTAEQRERLIAAAALCPVRMTLSKNLAFRHTPSES